MLLSPSVSKTDDLLIKTDPNEGDVDELKLVRWRDFCRTMGDVGKELIDKERKRLTPQSCVVSVQARAERPTGYEQLGTRVVIAVGVHSVGEGMNV